MFCKLVIFLFGLLYLIIILWVWDFVDYCVIVERVVVVWVKIESELLFRYKYIRCLNYYLYFFDIDIL